MANRWMEGFETDRDDTDFTRKYAVMVNSGTWTFTSGPKIGTALQNAGHVDAELRTKALVASVSNTWITGWRVRVATVTGTISAGDRAGGITMFSGSNSQVEVRVHSNGNGGYTWRVYRGTTLLGESSTFWDTDWWYWDFKFVVRTGTNGSVEIRRDGVTFYTLTGVNTANTGADGADRVRYLFQMGSVSSFDDMYVNDDSGANNNNYLSGDVVVFGSSPNADGNRVEWTPSSGTVHFSLVNDPPDVPSDTTKVKSQTPGEDDLYGYVDLALVSTGLPVLSVLLGTTGGMETSGSRDLKHVVRDTASEATGAAWTWNSTEQQHNFEIFEQNPVTSTNWTKTSLDAAQFGITLFA